MGAEVDHHGHHGPAIPKVPDYRIYKVEDVPRLVQARKYLASEGLRDPWIRNEVWRYTLEKQSSTSARFWSLWLRGFKPGLALAVATVGIEQAWKFMSGKDQHHHDDHH